MSLPTSSLSDPPHIGILNGSSGFMINNSNFQAIGSQHNHYYVNGMGLKELYRASMPEAAHDSYARKYASKCYPGTREQHIEDFVSWASKANHGRHRHFSMFWMKGPAGVGKSAIAQTCAEKIGKSRLGAAFFFSQPNQRDDPDRFFPSIAYQVSTQIEPFAQILDKKIYADPSILTKTIEHQFQELIVAPFLELKKRAVEIPERIVIIDGLDECRDDRAQCAIIEVIATAVREHGERLPFLWAFFSRPEPHIVNTFSSGTISPLIWMTTLPVSREFDTEVELYLRGEFENIRKRHHIPSSPNDPWPPEDDISKLVDKSAGLYVYASTAMKYIGDPDALDPMDRLSAVLSLRFHKVAPANDRLNPTAGLDSLYALIMQRIPTHILPLTRQILLLSWEFNNFKSHDGLLTVCEILGLSLPSLLAALSKLHSVLIIPRRGFLTLSFHHASFMEFLLDVDRSGAEFCIHHPELYGLLLKRALLFIDGFEAWEFPSGSLDTPRQKDYLSVCRRICQWIQLAKVDEELTALLSDFDLARHSKYLDKSDSELEALFGRGREDVAIPSLGPSSTSNTQLPLDPTNEQPEPRRRLPKWLRWLKGRKKDNS